VDKLLPSQILHPQGNLGGELQELCREVSGQVLGGAIGGKYIRSQSDN